MRWWAALAPVALCTAETPMEDLLAAKLVAQVRAFDDKLDGVLGFAAVDLGTGRSFGYNDGVVFPQASSIKIPILIEVFKQAKAGRFGLDDRVTVQPSEKVAGSGVLAGRLAGGPVTLAIRELALEMIRSSDNTATNRLIAMVGMGAVNRTLDELGFHATRLRRIMLDSAAATRNEENISTPLEMASLAAMLYRGEVLDGARSADMIAMMKTVKADFRAVIPPSVEVAAKPGELTGVRCETGVVYLRGRPFALSVMAAHLEGEQNPVGDVVKMVFHHFSKLARANRYGNYGVR